MSAPGATTDEPSTAPPRASGGSGAGRNPVPDPASFGRALESARANERDGWAQLYRFAAPRVLGFLHVRGASDPDDVLGEVWLRAVRAIDRFEGGPEEFVAWLLTTARNLLADRYRAASRRPVEQSQDPAALTETIATTDTYDDTHSERREGHAAALDLLAPLSERHRSVLYLRYALELEIEDVAAILGTSIAGTKMTLVRARRSLQRHMERTA